MRLTTKPKEVGREYTPLTGEGDRCHRCNRSDLNPEAEALGMTGSGHSVCTDCASDDELSRYDNATREL